MKGRYTVRVEVVLPVEGDTREEMERDCEAALQDLYFSLRHHTYSIVED